ncbi:MarR family winged helix-turn-helix transcriptional regulator [Amycolatopsis sp. PS_44_ISF1]|uniref:MarR family winged helix-turn-helix transcriptional regulator n=1 Tax=Amycolatopsis sp. PS_44_ISF1 TaxID=2974917 RepID=UPI0028E02F6C|nr:MarR family winged helix-turn-helix transcriptional regulator [Amycolatopsis sp. PS_44_ISF1]MDT8915146.1 MarR family winged helix-turn-helix transcriptional regulator [Amycolatopsis sp. PS_44_ISF1]
MSEEALRNEAIRREPALAALDETTLAVNALISASQDLTVRMAREMRMNVTDMRAILLLSEHGPLGATELAGRLGITLASTTVLVDRLRRDGYLERVRDDADRRRITLTVTASARTASLTAWLPAIRGIDEISRSLTGTERTFALNLLRRLAKAMHHGGRPDPGAGT